MLSDLVIMDNRSDLDRAFLQRHGWATARRGRLAGDASFRHYDRLHGDTGAAVLMDAPPPKEDVRPFVAVANWLADRGFSAPRVLAADLGHGFLLLEDLGDDRFSRVIPREPGAERALYAAAVDTLVALHGEDAPARLAVGGGEDYALPVYDEALYLREAFLFTDWYLPALLKRPVPLAWREEYAALWRDALARISGVDPVIVLRDYHADNLMWLPERSGVARVGLLDFQDAVAGHPAYDLVSLLEDARREVPPALAEAMIEHYLARAAAAGRRIDSAEFRLAYATLGAQRNAKIIGIFTRLYARDGKPHYLSLIARVWRLLERDLAHPALADLRAWFADMVPPELRRLPLEAAAVRTLPRHGLVLAAGLGLRMRPLTETTPKPLIPVGGEAMLDQALDQMAAAGVDHAVVNIHHLPEQMRAHVAARAGRLPAIALSDETNGLLDSGGGVRQALPHLGDGPFFVLNGDMLWRDKGAPALVRLAMAWDPALMDALLLVVPRGEAFGYDGAGDFSLDGEGLLARRGARPDAPYVFTGIQILAPHLVARAPEGPFSLNRLYDAAAAASRLHGLVHDGLWLHVGTPAAVAAATARLDSI